MMEQIFAMFCILAVTLEKQRTKKLVTLEFMSLSVRAGQPSACFTTSLQLVG